MDKKPRRPVKQLKNFASVIYVFFAIMKWRFRDTKFYNSLEEHALIPF